MNQNKNKINMYDAITNIDEKLIEDAMPKESSVSKRLSRKRIVIFVTSIAACLLICLFTGIQFFGNENNKIKDSKLVQSKIYITINPAICLDLSKDGLVLDVEALNEDGQNLLSDFEYQKKDRTAVAEELIQKAIDSGYLTKGGKVTLSIESENNEDFMKYDSEFKDIVFNNFGRERGINIEIRKIITLSKAKEIVLEYCGLKTAQFTGIKCDAGHDEAVYELKFVMDNMEYECKLDAVSGNIIYCEMKPEDSVSNTSSAERGTLPDKETTSDIVESSAETSENITSKTETQTTENVVQITTNSETVSSDSSTLETTASQSEIPITEPTAENQMIGEEAAKQIALQHAGGSQVSNTKVHLDRKDGKVIYEIEFYVGSDKYEYEVDAYSGKILEFDIDIQETTSQAEVRIISEDEAKQIAIQHAGITQAAFKKVKCDKDDGKIVYEIEFYAANNEYEYEIDGYSGKILDYDVDTYNTGISDNNIKNIISESEAKKIALQHAGVSQATFTEVKCDRDDGTIVYEIEFYTGNNEYEYEIDGYSGKILSFDLD